LHPGIRVQRHSLFLIVHGPLQSTGVAPQPHRHQKRLPTVGGVVGRVSAPVDAVLDLSQGRSGEGPRVGPAGGAVLVRGPQTRGVQLPLIFGSAVLMLVYNNLRCIITRPSFANKLSSASASPCTANTPARNSSANTPLPHWSTPIRNALRRSFYQPSISQCPSHSTAITRPASAPPVSAARDSTSAGKASLNA
jgi:hypothetical protein